MEERISIFLAVLLSAYWNVTVSWSSRDVRECGINTHTSSPSTGRCQPITTSFCSDIGYNDTCLPNPRNHLNQSEIATELMKYQPLVKTQCSPHFKTFLCYYYLPVCSVMNEPLPPCRTLCMLARVGCESLMNRFLLPWPDDWNCSRFPNKGLCVGFPMPDQINTLPPDTTVTPRAPGGITQTMASADALCSNQPPTTPKIDSRHQAPTCSSGNYSLTMWYYNSVSRRCRHFVYRGCGGDDVTACFDGHDSNSTWFCTIDECLRTCRRRSGANRHRMTSLPRTTRGGRQTTTARSRHWRPTRRPERPRITTTTEASRVTSSNDDNTRRCVGLPQRGACELSLTRWYYNVATSQCAPFVFGGCLRGTHGSTNRFGNRQECENSCVSSASATRFPQRLTD